MEIYAKVSPYEGSRRVIDVLAEIGFAKSKSHARRLIRQRGIKIDGSTVEDEMAVMVFVSRPVTAQELVTKVIEA